MPDTISSTNVHSTCPHDCPSTCALEVEKLDSHHIGRIRGVPRELIPLVPGSYTIEQASDFTLTYRLTGPNGLTTVLPREEVFHLRGPSWTGVAGLDALQVAREAAA